MCMMYIYIGKKKRICLKNLWCGLHAESEAAPGTACCHLTYCLLSRFRLSLFHITFPCQIEPFVQK
ncbi:hypothetical protein BDB00DRAFT_472629 [Zychaea mexicana]|uniref:uncharacterized protein n=1 Tax=Zychaea mexicana TaxID=64656 RepID=UPI0022FEFEA1|nr:uncharacterized protein BDB00DRAFT_472629 [Zychaea mexicana]KAI9491780.1 hypothetical protein BDB00DRAFT_472629 [Zychaea mexicana]